MKCPVDNEVLVIADRSGIEIDYCPTCRGVWLDRGELDRMIEKAEARPQDMQPRDQRTYEPRYDERRRNDDDDYRHGSNGGYHGSTPHKKKRESFLGELFDF